MYFMPCSSYFGVMLRIRVPEVIAVCNSLWGCVVHRMVYEWKLLNCCLFMTGELNLDTFAARWWVCLCLGVVTVYGRQLSLKLGKLAADCLLEFYSRLISCIKRVDDNEVDA